jgi:transposase
MTAANNGASGSSGAGVPRYAALLYMSAVAAIRCNPVIHALRSTPQGGREPAKVVIVTCMHKLLSIMNAMLKSNTPWNPKIA